VFRHLVFFSTYVLSRSQCREISVLCMWWWTRTIRNPINHTLIIVILTIIVKDFFNCRDYLLLLYILNWSNIGPKLVQNKGDWSKILLIFKRKLGRIRHKKTV